MSDRDEYSEYIDKAISGICPVCNEPYVKHDYPVKVPCPKCGSIKYVEIWEAWGHPNGDLYCQMCTGFYSDEPLPEYWTFRVVDGQSKLIPWHNQS